MNDIKVYGLVTKTITGIKVFLYADEEKFGWKPGDLLHCCSKASYNKMSRPLRCRVLSTNRIECIQSY
ncbi:MAG: hypothetical protein GT597_13815 [Bacteroidales bacterium]|jgi:hypothetical protein|nr:hypothetical protein [Bacteroidales bacterium]